MAAQQKNLDVIANNLANADVAGFKGAAAAFAEIAAPGGGLGTAELGTRNVFTQGKLMQSGGPFDIAIDGSGFFNVTGPHGRAFTRDGAFSRASDGTLRNAAGFTLAGVRIPAEASAVDVAENGNVTAVVPGGKRSCGTVAISVFASPEHLASAGGTVFTATAESGPPRAVYTGRSADAPKVRFGMLEQSNVSIVESMMQILEAQRAYEANAKGVQAADEMMRIANNLNRG